jgi:hypothetical protein
MAAMIIGAFIFLVIGFVELMIVQMMVYPILRARFEEAKVTASQGTDPARIMNFVKVQSLVLMPIVGYFMGNYFQKMAG